MKLNIPSKLTTINICKIALAAIIPVTVTSCMILTSAMPIEKLPEPIKSEMVQLRKDQEVMVKHFCAGSIKMNEAYISIFKGCGMEKEAQQLKINTDALKQASSSSEQNKLIKRGNDLIAEGRSTMAKSKNSVLASKEIFLKGFRQKDEAYMDLTKVSAEAGIQALAAAKTFKKTKNPLQKAACLAGVDPLIVVMKDIPVMMENERKFNAQTAEIGKKYSCPIPSSNLPTPKPLNSAVLY
jgi:hypothetical protein